MSKLFSLKIIAVFLFSLMSFQASAFYTLENVTIDRMYTYDDGVLIYHSTAGTNTDNCSYTYATNYIYFDTNAHGKVIYSAILAAYLANKPVSFGLSGCIDIGGSAFPAVYRVDF